MISINQFQESNIKISIITVVYNGDKYLEQAIKSVIAQLNKNVEYIIVDGGSTDRTCEIIKSYDSFINTWISEPDKGIYDAMNKGIKISSGNIIGILNADDVLNDGVIKKVLQAFQTDKSLDYVYGYVQRMTQNGVIYENEESLSQDEMEDLKFTQIPIPHGALFVKKELFEELGYYRTDFKINSDYDFILKLIENNKLGLQLDLAISRYRDGGESSGYFTFWERRILLKKYGVSRFEREWIVSKAIVKLFITKLLPKRFVSLLKQ